MSGLFYEFDPGGDVVFVLKDVPHSLPHSLGDLAASDLSGRHDRQPRPPNTPAPGPSIGMVNEVKPRSLHIQASSKHMTLASPQFMRTFQHGFREGTALHSVGHVEIPIYDWKPLPFLLLMAILHGRNRLVPRALSLHRLAEMAVLVDYYECYDAVVILSDLWIEAVGQDRPYLCGEKLMEWLCITWVFQRGIDFSLITGTIQLEIGGVITANNLPVPAAIIDKLQETRNLNIGKAIDCLHDVLYRLRNDLGDCTYKCNLMRLGTLDKGLYELGILSPTPEAATIACSFMELDYACYNMAQEYSFHHCSLMPEVFEVLNDAYESLAGGLQLESFTTLRERPRGPMESMRICIET